MANVSTVLDTIEARDLEGNSKLKVVVQSCSELGNNALPGLQAHYLGNILNLEPLQVERWAYQARKAGQDDILLDDHSWSAHADQFIRNSLVLGDPLKVRVEVKTRSRATAMTAAPADRATPIRPSTSGPATRTRTRTWSGKPEPHRREPTSTSRRCRKLT